MKCVWSFLLVAVVVAVVIASEVNGLPSPGNGLPDNMDPQEAAEMLEKYFKSRRLSPFNYVFGGLPWMTSFNQLQKRNSELINTILGLPNSQRDAGRRK